MNDIQQAQLVVFLEQTKQGVLKVVEGRFDAIVARILEDAGPPPPWCPLPWKYALSPDQWFDVFRGDVRAVVVTHSWRDTLPPRGADVHLVCEASGLSEGTPPTLVFRIKHARRINDLVLLLHLDVFK